MSIENKIDLLTAHYLECLEWADTPEEYIGEIELAEETKEQAKHNCRKFYLYAEEYIDNNLEQAGHDFWLSRQGHGSGFWDRKEIWGADKDKLHEIAESFGSLCVYVGDDNLLYAD